MKETKTCGLCNKVFEDYISNKRSNFCSLACYWTARKNNPKYPGYWTGKKRKNISFEKHYKWKGDDVGYIALHAWVRKVLGKPSFCYACGNARRKMYHWSNISGQYKRDISDWQRLCVPCHSKYDHK